MLREKGILLQLGNYRDFIALNWVRGRRSGPTRNNNYNQFVLFRFSKGTRLF